MHRRNSLSATMTTSKRNSTFNENSIMHSETMATVSTLARQNLRIDSIVQNTPQWSIKVGKDKVMLRITIVTG